MIGRASGTARALLRRRRVERDATIALFLLVAVTSFVAAAAPRWLDRVADAGIRHDLRTATATQRNLQFSLVGQIPAQEDEPFARVDLRGETLSATVPASVADTVGARATVIDSTRFSLADPPRYPTRVALGYASGIDEHIELVAGRAPRRVEPPITPAEPADPDDPPVPRFEIALAVDAAEATGMVLGETYQTNADPSDPMVRTLFPLPTDAIDLTVVGLYRPIDPADPFWFDETRLTEATIGGTDDNPIAYAVGLFAPEAYIDVRALDLPVSYRWRFLVDPERLDAGRLDELVPDLRRLATSYGPTTVRPGSIGYRSGLLDIIDRFEGQRAATIASLSVAAIGPFAVAAGAIGLIALIIVRRRRPAIVLSRARGASAAQLLGTQLVEGLLVTIPAAILGLAVAMLLLPARWSPLSAFGALGVGLATTGILLVATWPLARRARGDLERPDQPPSGFSARRFVVEVTIVFGALAAIWLLRERTLAGGAAVRSSDGPAPFDPFLAAAPVLLGIAVGVLAIRAYPLPVRATASALARRRDLVPVLGLRSVGRHAGAAYLPLLVLTLTVAIGVFSSVVSTTVERGQDLTAWQSIGGDFRVDAPPGRSLDAGIDAAALGAIPGVTGAADVRSEFVAPVATVRFERTPTLLHAIDVDAYASLAAGTPVEVDIPPAMADPAPPAATDPGSVLIPALVSRRAPTGWPVRQLGDTFELDLDGQTIRIIVSGFAESFPGISRDATFAVIPLSHLSSALDRPLRPTAVHLRGDAEVATALAEITGTGASAALASRYDALAAFRDTPLVAAVGSGFLLALGIAVGYAALAVMAIVALDAARRARELAYLRTMGLSERQMIGLTIVEHAPPVIVALATGTLVGLALAWVLEPGLDLAAFIDAAAPVVIEVDRPAIVGVAVIVVAVVAVAVMASSLVARRLDPARALRMDA